MEQSPLCRNAQEIGLYIGEDKKKIPYLVDVEGLPAFRRDEKGKWKARKESLDKWVREQELKYCQNIEV